MTGKVAEDAQFHPIRYGNYLLLDRINVGGMAEVFRAKSSGMAGVERLVAIKRILPHLAQDQGFTNMFIDEARIAINLRHANIAQLYELNQIDQSLFIAMEYVQGRDLRALINRMRFIGRAIPLSLIVYVISKVCEGLDYAHRKRDDLSMRELEIVHRDVSPQNIILSYEGEVKIIDFGIAKATAKRSHTQAGILKGKFGYMAPEQVMGREIDRRADIFCTGILAYELLTRERLFAGSNELSTLRRIRQREITPPTIVNPGIPSRIEETVLQALALEPEDRFQYASDFGDALIKALFEVGEDAFSSRQLRTFMHEVFGKDLKEDQQRLEKVLLTAGKMDDSEVDWKTQRSMLSGSPDYIPTHESMTEGTNEQTNPSWRGDSLAVDLDESQKAAHYPDTPSPFGDRRKKEDQKFVEPTHESLPLGDSVEHDPTAVSPPTRTSKAPVLPTPVTPVPPRDVFSTQETFFSEEWNDQTDQSAKDVSSSFVEEDIEEDVMQVTDSQLIAELEPVIDDDEPGDLARVQKIDIPTHGMMPSKGPVMGGANRRSPDDDTARSEQPQGLQASAFAAPPVESFAAPPVESFPSSASMSEAPGFGNSLTKPPEFAVTNSPISVMRGDELAVVPEMISPTIHRPAPPRRSPVLEVEQQHKAKKSSLRVWLLMWGFLLISLAGMLYLLLIVPPPEPEGGMYPIKQRTSVRGVVTPRTPSRTILPKRTIPARDPIPSREPVVPATRTPAVPVNPRPTRRRKTKRRKTQRRKKVPVRRVRKTQRRPKIRAQVRVRKKTFSLWVDSNPSGADLFVNGRLQGKTPKILSSSKNRIQVELRLKGYQNFRKTWAWTAKSSDQVSWKLSKVVLLQKGYLTVRATPSAVIYINGMTTDKNSLTRYAVKPGNLQISFVTKDGEVWDEKVRVQPGKETKLHSKYKKK